MTPHPSTLSTPSSRGEGREGFTMKIERVDESTIKCYISTEEMEEYQIEYTDFLSRTDKAQELMRRIINQAHEEVGYQPPKFAFEMQIMMVPDQGMVLTFTEKEPIDFENEAKLEAFLAGLRDFVNRLTSQKEKLAKEVTAGGLLPGLPKSGNNAGKAKVSADKIPEIKEAVFVFSSLSEVINYVEVLPEKIRITSTLYKMNDNYFLHITRGAASYERYSRACVQALEFADLYRADVGCDEILKEHGECLIGEKAIKKLRGYA